MYEWQKQIQTVVDEIDESIRAHDDEALTLRRMARRTGYSEFYMTRKFAEISGMRLRDYLRDRRLAFALKEVRDSGRGLLEIALDYGFSSNEAFTRAFKRSYGVTPSAYRQAPRPVVLRTKIHPFDRYFFGLGEIGMVKSKDGVKTYFVRATAIGISGRSRRASRDRTARRSADCLTASRGNSTMRAAARTTAWRGRSWGIGTTRRADCASGATRARNATACA